MWGEAARTTSMMGRDHRAQYPDEEPYVRHLQPPAHLQLPAHQHYDPAVPPPRTPFHAAGAWPIHGMGHGWWPEGAHAGMPADWPHALAHPPPPRGGDMFMGVPQLAGGAPLQNPPVALSAQGATVVGKKKTGPKPNLEFEKQLFEAIQMVPSLFRADLTIQRSSFAQVKEIAREVRDEFGEDERVQKLSFSDSWVTDFLTKHGLRKARGGSRKRNFKPHIAEAKVEEMKRSLLETGFPTNVVESSARPLSLYIQSSQQRIEKRALKQAAAAAAKDQNGDAELGGDSPGGGEGEG